MDGLTKYAPDAIIEPDVYESLSPLPETSYTQLWISALSAPPNIERMAPLADGAIVGDGKYTILSQIGSGGQATVYKVRTGEPGSQKFLVAKEYILPIGVTRGATRSAIETLQHEANLLKRLNHPQIVKLIEFFIEDHAKPS